MVRPRKIVAAFMGRDQEFQVHQASDAEAAASHHQIEIAVFFSGDTAIEQIRQLYPFVHAPEGDRPAAIVIETVTGDGLERVAREAVEAGIGWILLNRRVPYVDTLRAEHPELAIGYVATDHVETGRIQGCQLRALLPDEGSVLYIEGKPDASPSQERLAGTRQALEGSSLTLRVYAGDWTRASGRKAASGWLRFRGGKSDRPRAVAAQNDLMAAGAREAFLELRPDWADIPFLGCDGLPEGGQRLVRAGELAATVVTPSNAGQAVTLIAEWLETGAIPPAQVLLPPRSYPELGDLHPRRR